MDDSGLFMQWAMETLEQEQPVAIFNDDPGEVIFPSIQVLRSMISHGGDLILDELLTDMEMQAHAAPNRGSSGETTDDGSGGNFSSRAPMHHGVSNSVRCAPIPNHGRSSGPIPINYGKPVMSWNYGGASALPGSDGTRTLELEGITAAGKPYEPNTASYGSHPMRRAQTMRRASAKSNAAGTGPASASAPMFALDHTMAERKRREKIKDLFIELSAVIPGLKKMDKATILSDTTRHVKQLQEKVKALEVTGGGRRVVETVVLVKKPCYDAAGDDHGSPSSALSVSSLAARNPVPEIEVCFTEKGVMMVRIVCDDAKGVVVRLLSEVEEGLHLSITHVNVLAFTASTKSITITAKVEEEFTVTTEDIVGRLNFVLQQQISCNSTIEIRN